MELPTTQSVACTFWFSLVRQVYSFLEVAKERSNCCFLCFLLVVPAGCTSFSVVLPDSLLAAKAIMARKRPIRIKVSVFRMVRTSRKIIWNGLYQPGTGKRNTA